MDKGKIKEFFKPEWRKGLIFIAIYLILVLIPTTLVYLTFSEYGVKINEQIGIEDFKPPSAMLHITPQEFSQMALIIFIITNLIGIVTIYFLSCIILSAIKPKAKKQ